MNAALDTSGQDASFALCCEGRLVVHLTAIALGRKSAELFPILTEAMAEAGLEWDAIRAWTVGMGPGSFTGIRIGAAFVQGICAGTGASCTGVPSSLALARAGARPDDRNIAVLNDGRRGEMIVSLYEKVEADWLATEAPLPLPITQIHELSVDCLIISATDRALNQMPESICHRLVVLPGMDAANLLRVSSLADPAMNPVYVRPAVFVNPTPN